MTLVQAATQIVEIAAIPIGDGPDDVLGIGVECKLSGNEADCIQIATLGAGGATTVEGTLPIQPTAVPILNAKAGGVPSPATTGLPSNTPNSGNGGGFGDDNGDDNGSGNEISHRARVN